MNSSINRIWLDLHDSVPQLQVNAKQGDTARTLIIYFAEDGVPYQIEEGVTATICIRKPDNTVVYNNCEVDTENSCIIYDFTEQTVGTPGIDVCEIRLYGTSTNIASPNFTIRVEERVVDDTYIESSDEFSALTEAIQETNNLDIAAEKEGGATTVTITHKDRTESSVVILDGFVQDGGVINCGSSTDLV